ncbi:TetR/AcrR family transcriptional regulator [Pedobacter sp. MR2016-24]|uniref:TetR/AcrR family transcriptional regulator n=1 Tax=Pedobacter sp. MR2016-24 TaxID=2994466 RepID=UPI002246BE4D|nr:TetR/AcrR family transcriptional regulator [Pedobacter sp. MR2016-24]MCX2481943.1 TetR/AcrR family transcriptional regulator [Pedobacter sp. MR2016-24]
MEKPDKKANILSAAETLFSELGYEGTSTRQIAKESGANMSMINYYFGSKEGVFLEIMNQRLQEFNVQLTSINEERISSMEKLMQIIESYTRRILNNISFHKMMHRELSLAQRPEMFCKLKDAMSLNLNVIEQIINEGIAEGSFKPIDIRMLIASIMGTITNVATMPSKITRGSVLDITIPEDREVLTQRLILHLKDLVTTYITPQK